MTPYRLVGGQQHFEGIRCCHAKVEVFCPWWRRQYVLPKRW